MGRLIAISDIHGMAGEFQELLKNLHYSPDTDQLILLGDYVDWGPFSKGVLELAMNLSRNYGAVVLRGNHEEMLMRWLDDDKVVTAGRYIKQFGATTLRSFWGESTFNHDENTARQKLQEMYADLFGFVRKLPYYHEKDGHVFVHAGINPELSDWRDTTLDDMLTIREAFYSAPFAFPKTIVFGHTPCFLLHGTPDIWFGERKIGIDGGCAHGYQLNALVINDEGYQRLFVPTSTEVKRS